MKKSTLLSTSLLASAFAFTSVNAAEGVLSCHFTEPFISIDYDAKTKVITRLSPENYDENGVAKPEVISTNGKLVKVRSVKVDKLLGISANEYELRDGKNKILSLVLNMKGSDGMSDFTFPFDARMPHAGGVNGQLWGGCATDDLKPVCPQDGGC